MTEQPQHLQALTYGNRVRFVRAAVHQEIRGLPAAEARDRVAEILEAGEKEWRTMRVFTLLRWPRYTPAPLAHQWLREAGISRALWEIRIVGELSPRQRRVLADCLRDERWPVDRRAA